MSNINLSPLSSGSNVLPTAPGGTVPAVPGSNDIAGRVTRPVSPDTPRFTPQDAAPEIFARPYTAIGEAAGYFGQELERATLPGVRAQGGRAVTRDPDGNIRVAWRWEFTDSDRAFNAGAQQRALAEARSDITRQMMRLRLQYDGDPEGFQAAANAYQATVVGRADDLLQPFIQDTVTNQATEHFTGIVRERRRLDIRRADQALTARQTSLERDMYQMAEEGGVNTDAYRSAWNERADILSQRERNPNFVYTREQRGLDDRDFYTEARIRGILGHARRQYETSDDLAGTIQGVEEQLRDASLALTPQQQLEARRRVEGLLTGSSAVRRETRRTLVEESGPLIQRALDGDMDSVPRLNEIVSELRRSRAHSDATRISTQVEIARALPGVRSADPAERARTMERVRSLARGESDYETWVRQRESAGDDTAQATTSSATGRYQFIESTWNDLRRRRPELNLTADGRTDPAQQERAMRALTDENRTALQGAGFEATNGNLYLAHFLGAGGAIATLRANPDRQFTADLYPEAADAIRANRRVLQGKTVGEVIAWAGRGSDVVNRPALRAIQTQYDEQVRAQWNDVREAIGRGQTPTPDEWEGLAQQLPFVGNQRLRREIHEAAQVREAIQRVTGLPLAQQQRMLDELDNQARQGGLSPIGRELMSQWRRQSDRQVRTLSEDPKRSLSPDALRVINTPLPQLTADSIEGFVQVADRMTSMARGANQNSTVGGVFSPTEAGQVGEILRAGSPEQITRAYSSIAAIRAENLEATLNTSGMREALLNPANTNDPGRFRAAMGGLDMIYQRDPELFARVFGEDGLRRRNQWRSVLSVVNNDQELMTRLRQRNDISPELRRGYDSQADSAVAARRVDTLAQDVARQHTTWLSRRVSSPARLGGEENAALGTRAPQEVRLLDARTQDAFYSDFRTIMRDEIQTAYGDVDLAQQRTVERMATMWRPSAVAGGVLMRNAPEQHYQQIGGSHDWLREQLDAEMGERFGWDRTVPRAGAPRSPPPYRLVATRETEEDIAAGGERARRPRYTVIYSDRNGLLHTTVWQGNPDGRNEEERARFGAARRRFEQMRSAPDDYSWRAGWY